MSEQMIPTPGIFGENGNFLLERALGQGGMGGVYMGRDKMLDRPVAVKVMLKQYGSDPEFVEKFKKEAQAAAKLIHPNIAQIYSYGISMGMPYIAMELVAGGDLDHLIRHAPGATDVTRVMKICAQVAQALRCSADMGYVHGDVKPENILLDANGNAKLVDFGLAAMQKDTNEIWGTPYYIAPEKVKRQGVDFRADMYSLGGTLYHALCGIPPFEGDDAVAVVKARFAGPPKKPSQVRPGLSPQIDKLVMTMLKLDPQERYPSWEALIAAFNKVITSGLGNTQKTAGTKRMTVNFGPRMTSPIALDSGVGGEKKKEAQADAEDTPGKKMRKVKRLVKNPDGTTFEVEEEEEDDGSGVGKKVLVSVGIGVAAIGLVVGGLLWYLAADRKAREAADRAEIASNIGNARTALGQTEKVAAKFVDDLLGLYAKATNSCSEATVRLAKLLPEYAAQMKPGGPAAPKGKEPPDEVIKIRELWDKAAACEGQVKTIVGKVEGVLSECRKAKAAEGDSREFMEMLGAKSRETLDAFEAAKNKGVDEIRKAVGLIRDRGEKTVAAASKRLEIEKKQAERDAAKAAEEAARKAREEARDKERAERVAREQGEAKAKWDALVAGKTFETLDWSSALRQLKSVKEGFTSPEGQMAADAEIRKVEAMQSVQTIFRRNLKGFEFKTSKLKKSRATNATEQQITLVDAKGKATRVSWKKFYTEYPGNLNELIRHFIEEGRVNGSPRLSLKDWAEAMCGAAMSMKLVCGGVSGAAERGEDLVRDVVEKYPDYQRHAQAMFPEIDFAAKKEK